MQCNTITLVKEGDVITVLHNLRSHLPALNLKPNLSQIAIVKGRLCFLFVCCLLFRFCRLKKTGLLTYYISISFHFIRSGVKSAVVLFPLLGITWLFGILALDSKTIVFQYLFAVCNSLQGFFIFIFHCLLNSEVRDSTVNSMY